MLSLFDGISGGQQTINRLGIKNYTYYASEINPVSIAITQKNYPNTIQLGDVIKLRRYLEADNRILHRLVKEKNSTYAKLILELKISKIDLLIFGSPCTDLTIIKSKDRESLEGKDSKLFYEALKIKELIKPDWFMMENVASMNEDSKDMITKCMGVNPIFINSNIFSAQDRERYYWTNIPVDALPKDKGIVLKDIIETNVDEKEYYKKEFTFNGWDKKVIATLHVNSHDMGKRVYNPNMKCATLTAIRGGYHEKKVYDNGKCRKLTAIEYERLQNVKDNYTYIKGITENKRRSVLGDGWTIDVIVHILKNIKQYYIQE